VEAEYKDTVGYFTSPLPELANRHAIAIGFMELLIPETSIKGSNTVRYRVDILRDEKHAAILYARQAAGGNIVRASLRSMRRYG